MTDRERLIKLLKTIEQHPENTCPELHTNKDCTECKYNSVNDIDCDLTARVADFLLANGVCFKLVIKKRGEVNDAD